MTRLWPYLRPHWRLVVAAVALIPVRVVLEMVPASLFGSALNHLAGVESFPGVQAFRFLAQPLFGMPQIPWLATMFFAIALIGASVELGRSVAMAVMGQRAMLALRSHLFRHV